MVFLVLVGGLQFLYCVLAGNYVSIIHKLSLSVSFEAWRFGVWLWLSVSVVLHKANTISQPFNAFLSGFSAAVGQFVLTASLRMQTSDSGSVSGSGNKAGSKKNARVEEEGMGGISHERLVYALPIIPTPYAYACTVG